MRCRSRSAPKAWLASSSRCSPWPWLPGCGDGSTGRRWRARCWPPRWLSARSFHPGWRPATASPATCLRPPACPRRAPRRQRRSRVRRRDGVTNGTGDATLPSKTLAKAPGNSPRSTDHKHQTPIGGFTMRNRWACTSSLLAAGLLLAATAAFAAGDVGTGAPAFQLKGVDGKTYSLTDFKGKVVVLEWVNPHCPFSDRHAREKTMTELARQHGEVVWLGINSTNPRSGEFEKPAD